jgi:hypothetical protein
MTLMNVSLILAVTAYLIFDIHRRRQKITCMVGMMIAMTIGMMVSISLGVFMGIYFNHDLSKSTILAVATGLTTGYLAGKPVSLMAALDGMLAGIMGGMMGAMLGVMLVIPTTMVWFINAIFFAVMFVLIQLIDEETGTSKKEAMETKKPFITRSGLVVGLIALTGVIIAYYSDLLAANQASSKGGVHAAVQDARKGDVQEATITVHSSGFGPQNLELKAGIPAIINFKTEADVGCIRQVVSKKMDINNMLEPATSNFIMVKALAPGTYRYTCGLGMYVGTITVK